MFVQGDSAGELQVLMGNLTPGVGYARIQRIFSGGQLQTTAGWYQEFKKVGVCSYKHLNGIGPWWGGHLNRGI